MIAIFWYSFGIPEHFEMTTPEQTFAAENRPVFLCYSSVDKQVVREIYRKLKAHGFSVWFDEEAIDAGQEWEYEIRKAVRRAVVIIVCLSKKSVTRAGFVHREIKLALDVAEEKPEGTVFIIPLRLEQCPVPERLRRWQWVDYFDPKGFDRLLKSLQNRTDSPDHVPSPIAHPARVENGPIAKEPLEEHPQAKNRGGRRRTLLKILSLILLLSVGIVIAWRLYRWWHDCGSMVNENITHRSGRRAAHYERMGNKDRILVFVHGIFGDAESTWTAPPDTYWPELILEDKDFNNTDVYVAAYDTHTIGNKMTIDEAAESLNQHFKADGVFSGHREVIFVCHSLGGLILQRLLLTYRGYATKVRLIYFYSTPQTGAQIANLARLASDDPFLREMAAGASNDYLMNLESEWKRAGFTIHRFCAYETLAYKCVRVVDRLSGTRGCDETVPLDKNHSTIVKPTSTRDEPHLILQNAWKELILRIPRPTPTPTPTATPSPSPTLTPSPSPSPTPSPSPSPSPTVTPPPLQPKLVEFKLKIEDQEGNPIPSAKISCSITSTVEPPNRTCDEDGQQICLIPRNQEHIWISVEASRYAPITSDEIPVPSNHFKIIKLTPKR